jgi:hypothetical protein
MVYNATFNNISAISWRSVLLVEEIGVPREKTTITIKAKHGINTYGKIMQKNVFLLDNSSF